MTTLKKYLAEEAQIRDSKLWVLKICKKIFLGTNSSVKVIILYRLAKYMHERKFHFFPEFLFEKIQKSYGVYISKKSSIDIGTKFPHPNGIVIGDGVKIGKNCTIYQQVTLGGARIGDAEKNFYPELGDDVVIFAGTKIIGKVSIGSRCIIGANSVVTKDIPNDCTVAGAPARIIKKIH